MNERTTKQIKADVDAQYAEKAASNIAFIKRFIEVYKLALAGDEAAMAEGQAMHDSEQMNENYMAVTVAMREAGLE